MAEPPDPRLFPDKCQPIPQTGLFRVASHNGQGLLVHKVTGERHVVQDYKDIHFYKERAFLTLRSGKKQWLDHIFKWVLWRDTDADKQFVISTSKVHGDTVMWLEELQNKRCILHPRNNGVS